MKKGIIPIIPLIAITVFVGIGTVGVAGVARSKTIVTSSVLSSKTDKGVKTEAQENKSKEKEEPDKSSSEGKTSKSDRASEKSSSEKFGVGGKKNVIEELEIEDDEDTDDDEGSGSAEPEATESVRPGQKIRTNFPITVNPVTGEKTVTTPGGVKTIILPEVAIQNMIKAGFPVVLPPEDDPGEATPSAPEGTPSGSTGSAGLIVDSEAQIQLTEENGELVYEIPAVKEEEFLGVFDVKIKVRGVVSAQNGEILKLKKSIFDAILDFLSV